MSSVVCELDELISSLERSKPQVSLEETKVSDAPKFKEASNVSILSNLIGSKLVKPSSNKYINNINPSTSEIISKVPRSNREDLELAVKAAKEAFKKWSKLSGNKRSSYLYLIADEIEKNAEEFAKTESMDVGKPIMHAKSFDIGVTIQVIRYFASMTMHESTETHLSKDQLNYVQRVPLGVCGTITPWNYPFNLLMWKLCPAIVLGNCVICKPSELTPLTSHLLSKILVKINLPPGVVNILQGYGNEIGRYICEHKDIVGISYTGGTVTGKKIASVTAPLFKKVHYEMGGKNATIIFNDCNFELTLKNTIMGGFFNTGQTCVSGKRIFLEKGIAPKFTKVLIDVVKKQMSANVGDPSLETTSMGPLISYNHRNKVEGYIKLAKEEGGKILLGGERPKDLKEPFCNGFYYMPTIISNLDPLKHRCAKEEIFGPVITLHTFDNEEELMKMVNCVEYGLSGAVFTQDIKKGHRIAHGVDSGYIWINCWGSRDNRTPFGGMKLSGHSNEGGTSSIEFWTHQKNICLQL